MKKDLQFAINTWVENTVDRLNEEIKNGYFNSGVRLRTCNAYVFESENFYFLRSYNTVVACVNKTTGQKYDFLRLVYGYTSTSAQHISKFFHDYADSRIAPFTYRDI